MENTHKVKFTTFMNGVEIKTEEKEYNDEEYEVFKSKLKHLDEIKEKAIARLNTHLESIKNKK